MKALWPCWIGPESTRSNTMDSAIMKAFAARSRIKRVILLAVMVMILAHSGKVLRVLAGLYICAYDLLKPWQKQVPAMHYLIALTVVLAFWFASGWLLHRRK